MPTFASRGVAFFTKRMRSPAFKKSIAFERISSAAFWFPSWACIICRGYSQTKARSQPVPGLIGSTLRVDDRWRVAKMQMKYRINLSNAHGILHVPFCRNRWPRRRLLKRFIDASTRARL